MGYLTSKKKINIIICIFSVYWCPLVANIKIPQPPLKKGEYSFMKIAIVIKSLSLSGGGAERFSRNLIRGLLTREHDISVFCFDWDEGTEQLGISLHKIPKLSKYKHP